MQNMNDMDNLIDNDLAQATVMAMFRSAVAAFYVDISHDWYKRISWSESNFSKPLPEHGCYTSTITDYIKTYIPITHQAECQLKFSREYISNYISELNPEFQITVPLTKDNATIWISFFITMIDREADGRPHHVVFSARNATQSYIKVEEQQALIDTLSQHTNQQGKALDAQAEELAAQNQELAALSQQLLHNRDELYELTDHLQNELYNSNMYTELLNLQQSGVLAYDIHTRMLKYMNQKAMEYFEVADDDYQGRTVDFLMGRAKLRNRYNIQQDLEELRNSDGNANLECSITNSRYERIYLSITSKQLRLESGEHIVVDVLNDITERVLLHEKLEATYAITRQQLDSANNALMRSAECVYHVDLSTGLLLDNIEFRSGLRPLEALQLHVPCSYDEFLQRIVTEMGVSFINNNGETDANWSCVGLLHDFSEGITNAEMEYWYPGTQSCHRVNGLMSQDNITGHVMLTVINTDITRQRRKEYLEKQQLEEARLSAERTALMLSEARQAAEMSNALLQEKQGELEEKHQQLEVAYNDLQEYTSIIRALRSIFDTCYFFSVKEDTFIEITGNRQIRPLFKNIYRVRPAIMAYLEADVDKKYWPDMRIFENPDVLADALKDKPFLTLEFESKLRGWCRGYLIPAQYDEDSNLTHCLYACEIIDEQKRIHKHLKHIAETDGLTGINNRAGGESKINSFIAQSQPGFFGILDCDYFKLINDTYGHKTGDRVLINVANALAEAFGDSGVVMRLGGDEFAFFLPSCTSHTRLKMLVNRFFTILSTLPLPDLADQQITVSVGATFYNGIGNTSFDEIYELADRHLYESKRFRGNKLTYK